MKKGPFGPGVSVQSAANVRIAEHNVALWPDLLPPHEAETLAQLCAQQACIGHVLDRNASTVDVTPEVSRLDGTASLRELGQQLLRNIVLGLDYEGKRLQDEPRLQRLLDITQPDGTALAPFSVVDVELFPFLDPVRDGYPAKHWMPDHIVIVESVGAGMQCGGDRVAGGHASASALFGMGT